MKNYPSLAVKISQDLERVGRAEWDNLFPPVAEGYGFFKTTEDTLSNQFRHYYICIYEYGRLACLAPCFVMDYPFDTTLPGPLKRLARWLKPVLGRLLLPRVLICGSPACEGRLGLKNSARHDLVARELGQALAWLVRHEKAGLIAFKDFSETYTGFLDRMQRFGYGKIMSYPSVTLDINFGSFEEYLATLSHASRKSLRRDLKTADQEAVLKMEVQTSLSGHLLDRAYNLYVDTLRKSDVQFERLTRNFFADISANMPQETRFFLWFLRGALVAFDLCLVKDNVLVDEYIGLDYNVAYKYHLYFVTFRDILVWCIANGIRRYESGALNYDPKKRLCFRPVVNYIYVRHRSNLLNPFFRLIYLLLKPENFDPQLKNWIKEYEK